MSHCDNCEHIDRLEDARASQSKRLVDVRDFYIKVDNWRFGKGFRRHFFSDAEIQLMLEGARAVERDASKKIDGLEKDIEAAEKSTIEGRVKLAAKKMAADLDAAMHKPLDPVAAVKGFAEMMDGDLKFEDKVADLKLTDLPAPGRFIDGGSLAPEGTPLPKPCDCGVGFDKWLIHHEWCASLPKPALYPGQVHAHQGTHYVGDDCKPKHTIKGIAELKAEEEVVPAVAVERTELIGLYAQLPTPELKVHVEAALDAAVARGVSLTVGETAARGYDVRIKKTSKPKKRK